MAAQAAAKLPWHTQLKQSPKGREDQATHGGREFPFHVNQLLEAAAIRYRMGMGEVITSGDLNDQECREADRLQRQYGGYTRLKLALIAVVIAFCFAAVLSVVWPAGQGTWLGNSVRSTLPAAFLAAIVLQNRFRRQLFWQQGSMHATPLRITISELGIVIEGGGWVLNSAWTSFAMVTESETLFACAGEAAFVAIPKRGLDTSQVEVTRGLAAAAIPRRLHPVARFRMRRG